MNAFRRRSLHGMTVIAAACVAITAMPAAAQRDKPAPYACDALTTMPAAAQRGKPVPHARVTLVADGPGAGAPLTLGVRFQLDPEWHVYWRNAGGSGSPPAITWTPVPGLKPGEIQWPTPVRIRVDDIVSYGYHRDVLLLVPLERSSAANRAVTMTAKVDYVICRDICVKESATVTLALPAAAAMPARSPDAALFEQTRARLPKPAPADWTATAHLGAGEITLRVATQTPPPTATFFPFVNGLIDDPAVQRVESDARGLTLHLVKSPYFGKAPAALEGVLVLDAARAFTLKAPFNAK